MRRSPHAVSFEGGFSLVFNKMIYDEKTLKSIRMEMMKGKNKNLGSMNIVTSSCLPNLFLCLRCHVQTIKSADPLWVRACVVHLGLQVRALIYPSIKISKFRLQANLILLFELSNPLYFSDVLTNNILYK